MNRHRPPLSRSSSARSSARLPSRSPLELCIDLGMDGACVLLYSRRDGCRLDHAVGLQAAAHHRERAAPEDDSKTIDGVSPLMWSVPDAESVADAAARERAKAKAQAKSFIWRRRRHRKLVCVKLYGAVIGHFDAEVSPEDLLRTLERARLRFHRFFNG